MSASRRWKDSPYSTLIKWGVDADYRNFVRSVLMQIHYDLDQDSKDKAKVFMVVLKYVLHDPNNPRQLNPHLPTTPEDLIGAMQAAIPVLYEGQLWKGNSLAKLLDKAQENLQRQRQHEAAVLQAQQDAAALEPPDYGVDASHGYTLVSGNYQTAPTHQHKSNSRRHRERALAHCMPIGLSTGGAQPSLDELASVRAASSQKHVPGKVGGLRLLVLALPLGGVQLVSSIQSVYATSYLQSMGMSLQATLLVWFIGPLAAGVVQPVMGVLSANAPSPRLRAELLLLSSTLIVALSQLYLIYAVDFPSLFQSSAEDTETGSLDMAVGVTADLLLALLPPEDQNRANARASRVSDALSLLGYILGWLDLSSWVFFGNDGTKGQFRTLGWIAISVVVILGVGSVVAAPRKGRVWDQWQEAGLGEVWRTLRGRERDVPKQVWRVCVVQFLAWAGLFPFLYYDSSYLADILAVSTPTNTTKTELLNPSSDAASRIASLALIFFSIVSLVCSAVLPYLVLLADRFPHSRLAGCLTLRNLWTFGLVVHAAAMLSTFWADDAFKAGLLMAIMGLAWAVESWVPYALIMHCIRDVEDASNLARLRKQGELLNPSDSSEEREMHSLGRRFLPPRPAVYPHGLFAGALLHRSNIIAFSAQSLSHSPRGRRGHPDDPFGSNEDENGTTDSVPSAILTLHNLSLTLPQLLVAFLAFLAFTIYSSIEGKQKTTTDQIWHETGEVVWLFRAGGAAALAGAVAARWVEETDEERWKARMR
ncbi:hypothetical protein JCM10207_001345 [Rhodosporidiobolus poonsookiae]